MYPEADIPVVQFAINGTLAMDQHYQIGTELAKLRSQGVLIVGSGNIVHNLVMMSREPEEKPQPWATEFDSFVKDQIDHKDYDILVHYNQYKSAMAKYALPTNEHYIPLLYVIGAAQDDTPQYINAKITYSSVSMRCVIYGAKDLQKE
jgi:4,5-DOPA dioxygenase extradiol